ncbi:LysR family transcriptional regulator [Herbaspirillum sp. HC18]|nr:LysR family transcriptional regulator [Herbaspirillum sp. HC18]
MNVTLKQIRAFLAIAEYGTYSRASLALHISQPALTRLIQDLEAAVDLRLVERSSNGTRLTIDGEEFRPIASQLVRDMENSVKDLKQRSKGIRGTVTLAVGTAFSTTFIPPLIRHCRDTHPGIKIVVRDDNSEGIVQRVADGEADFGIGSLVGDLSRLTVQPLLSAPLGVLASPDHFPLPDKICLADVMQYPIIYHSPDTSIWHILNKNVTGASLAEHGVAVATNLATVMAFVTEGVGVTVMSALGASAPMARNLQFVPLLDEGVVRKVYIFSRNSTPLSKAASVVRDQILSPEYRGKLRDQVVWY